MLQTCYKPVTFRLKSGKGVVLQWGGFGGLWFLGEKWNFWSLCFLWKLKSISKPASGTCLRIEFDLFQVLGYITRYQDVLNRIFWPFSFLPLFMYTLYTWMPSPVVFIDTLSQIKLQDIIRTWLKLIWLLIETLYQSLNQTQKRPGFFPGLPPFCMLFFNRLAPAQSIRL